MTPAPLVPLAMESPSGPLLLMKQATSTSSEEKMVLKQLGLPLNISPRSRSRKSSVMKQVRFAADATGHPKCTIHMIPPSTSRLIIDNATPKKTPGPISPPNSSSLKYLLGCNNKSRFQADSGRDFAPVRHVRRSVDQTTPP